MSYRVAKTSLNMPDKLYKPGDALSDEAAKGIPAGNLAVLLREGNLVKEGEPEQDAPESGVIPLKEVEPDVDVRPGKSIAPAALAQEIALERGSKEPTRTEEQAIKEIEERREENAKAEAKVAEADRQLTEFAEQDDEDDPDVLADLEEDEENVFDCDDLFDDEDDEG